MADPATLDPAQATLDELRMMLAPLVAENAVFDGWSETALTAAADSLKVDSDVARLAFTSEGQSSLPMAMLDAWIASVDAVMGVALPLEQLATMKIRERIRALVQFRLDAVAGLEEAVRRGLAIMAMPQNAPRAAKIGWRSADAMWRLAGDTATDYNHYTKRAILAAIYAATLTSWLEDESEGKADTRAFLERRIDGVMRFEKVKAQILRPDAEHFSMARFLGRLRYPAR